MEGSVQMQFFGTPRIERAGAPLHGFESRKALALLGYLAARRVAVPRSQLVDLFWPQQPEERGRGNLRRVLHNLATLLPGCLATERQTVQVTSIPTCTIDLWAFDDLVAQDTHSALVAAAALYRGPLMEGLYLNDCPEVESWLTQEREHCQQRAIAVLEELIDQGCAQRDWTASLQAVDHLLTLDPWREAVHRDKMRVLAASGQRDAALMAYDACRRVLAEELGIEPEDETTTLYEQLRAGMLPVLPEAHAYYVPTPPTSLLGRDEALAEIVRLVLQPHCRLLTLTGPGGIGKTHLALAVVAEVAPRFADGVFFVDLAPISDPALLVSTIARALSVQEGAPPITAHSLSAFLRDKQVLLCLDNFEQLLNAASAVSELVARSPRMKILVTSRAALNVRGEQVVPIDPLALPDPQRLRVHRAQAAATLMHSPAAALFIERAVNALPTFAATDENASVLAEICVCLEGLPLAIELAAPHLKVFSPEMMLVRLDQRLAFLTIGRRDQPPRHAAMRATVDWSYQLLDAVAQAVFARLAVFVGGWTLAEAEAVASGDGIAPQEVAGALLTLVDHSLVRQQHNERGEPRFGMLETLREYALEQLVANDGFVAASHQHLATFLSFAETAASELHGSAQSFWFAHLAVEHDNMRAALQWAHETGHPAYLLRLANALHLFWLYCGHQTEGRCWLERGLQMPSSLDPELTLLRAHAFYGAGLFAAWEDDPQAAALFDASVTLFHALGDPSMMAQVLYNLGSAYAFLAAYPQAEHALAQSLEIACALDDPFLRMHATARLGICASFQGDAERAQPLLEAGLAQIRRQGDRQFTVVLTMHLGKMCLQRGDLARAEALFGETLAEVQHVRRRVVYPLAGLAGVALQRGDMQRAARLIGAVAALNISLIPASRPWYNVLVAAVNDLMGNEAVRHAWMWGQQMSLEEAVAYAYSSVAGRNGTTTMVRKEPETFI